VLAARDRNTSRSREALSALCESYWPPLYAFVRHRGQDPEQARDLTQAFFVHLLENHAIEQLTPETGRFRSFLLTSLRNFLADEHDRDVALKRGAGRTALPLDIDTAERGYAVQPSHNETPESLFERRWAHTVLQRVLGKLREDQESHGHSRLFERLKPCLTGERPARSYRELAADLEMTEDAVKMAVHRMRKRFAKTLRAEIAETVSTPEEIDDEIRHLLSLLRG
jgi:RNA polymerase sigma factor (sigma-70 family)